MSRMMISEWDGPDTLDIDWDIKYRTLIVDGADLGIKVNISGLDAMIRLMAGLASSLPQVEIRDGWINPRQKATERAIEAIQELARVYRLVSEQSAQIQKAQDVNEQEGE